MNWIEKLFGKKDPSIIQPEELIPFLKEQGYWEPLPGTKAGNAEGPLKLLHFAYSRALAFAVDVDSLATPKPIVHIINSETDVKIYSDLNACKKAVAEGYCSPSVLRHRWVVVRKETPQN